MRKQAAPVKGPVKAFDRGAGDRYAAPVNRNRNLLLANALLLCGAAVGF